MGIHTVMVTSVIRRARVRMHAMVGECMVRSGHAEGCGDATSTSWT